MIKRVLIAKDASSVADLQQRLRDEGIQSIAIPPIIITRIAIKPGFKIPDKATWIVFTSPHSVEIFKMILLENEITISKKMKFAAIGIATANRVEMLFGRIEMAGDGDDGQTFGMELLDVINNEDYIFWPCATKTAGGFETILRESGINLEPFPIYKTTARPSLKILEEVESGGPYTSVIYYSPSGVGSLLEAVPALKTLPAVAIGHTTEQALVGKGISIIVVPSDQSPQAMIDALNKAFTLNNACIMDDK